MILKQIKFDPEDLAAVEQVQRKYGCDSFSQAVRVAARVAAAGPRAGLPVPASPRTSNARREAGSVAGIIGLPPDTSLGALDALLTEVAGGYRFALREPKEVYRVSRKKQAR